MVLPAGSTAGGCRSRLDDGRLVVWSPPPGLTCALDAERRREPPDVVAARAEGDPWIWWTRLEVLCKLYDVPVLVALRDGLNDAGCALRTVEQDGLVITFGAR